MRARAAKHAGEEEARIFDVQMSILEDSELIDRVEELIRQNLAAEKAFDIVMLDWRHHFARHSSPMLRERVGDLTDVQIRVLSLLLGLPDHDPVDVPKGSNAILVTHDLTPSLTVQLDREAIAAIATDAGTRTSHVAILARSLGLPAVVGLRDATAPHDGETAILDGAAGMLSINPTAEEIDPYHERARARRRSPSGARSARGARGGHDSMACARAARERRLPRGGRSRRAQRRRGRGADAHRVSRRRAHDDAGRGGAVSRVSPRGSRRSTARRW